MKEGTNLGNSPKSPPKRLERESQSSNRHARTWDGPRCGTGNKHTVLLSSDRLGKKRNRRLWKVSRDRRSLGRAARKGERDREFARKGEMGIRFVLLVNKQGQTRLAQYYEHLSLDERRALEGEIVRKCLARTDQQCSFVEHRNYKVVYRRYASLFFLVGVDNDENELAILEFIHLLVETMDRHFGNVCELDIMFHLEKVHFMLEEMVMNGCIVETSKQNILAPIQLMEKTS